MQIDDSPNSWPLTPQKICHNGRFIWNSLISKVYNQDMKPSLIMVKQLGQTYYINWMMF